MKRKDHRVLQWVNEERAQLGRPAFERLPRGIPGNPSSCVIARCFSDVPGLDAGDPRGRAFASCKRVFVAESVPLPDGRLGIVSRLLYPPRFVSRFISRFDRLRRPDLIGTELPRDVVAAADVMSSGEQAEIAAAAQVEERREALA